MPIYDQREFVSRKSIVFLVLSLFLSMQSIGFAGSFELVSRGNNGSLPSALFGGEHSAITPDGRYVVFRSGEAGFVSPATTGKQIFLRDRLLGKTELVSQGEQGAGNGSSDWPAISNDGCRVVYESDATNLVSNDSNGTNDIFMLDRCSDPNQATTSLVSVNSSGLQANGESRGPDISADGNMIVFWSAGTNLGVTEPFQVYRRNLVTQTTELVSRKHSDSSRGGNGRSYYPAVSDNGKRITFWSSANDLVTGDSNGSGDIFLYDVDTGMQLVSSDSAGVQQTFTGDEGNTIVLPAISGDGRYVAFLSPSSTLVENDTNAVSDIFVKDSQTAELRRVSVKSDGTQADLESLGRPALSLDGSWVVFLSQAKNLVTETVGENPHIFAHNTQTLQTISFSSAPSNDYPAISGDLEGRFVSAYWHGYVSPLYSAGVFVYDRNADVTPTNQPPIAAGTRPTVMLGDVATLDPTGSSDPEGVPLTYTWSWISGPENVTLSDTKVAMPTFTPTKPGAYLFQLVVKDDIQNSKPGFVAVDVLDNGASFAMQINAGEDRLANIGDPVKLQSTVLSSDPAVNLKKLKYKWKLLSGPVKGTVPVKVKLSGNGKSRNTGFTPSVPGYYLFGVESSQGDFKSQQAIVTIEVNPDINVSEPTAATVWQVGTVANINWSISGVNPNKRLAIIYSIDQEKGQFLLLKNGVKAGKGNTSIKVNKGLVSDKAFVAVCLLKTAKNDLICGNPANFKVQ